MRFSWHSRPFQYWRRLPLWLRAGLEYVLFYVLCVVSQPPWPFLPGNHQQQALANETLGLSMALGLVGFIYLYWLFPLLAPRQPSSAVRSRGRPHRRCILATLALASLPWCALAVTFLFPTTTFLPTFA